MGCFSQAIAQLTAAVDGLLNAELAGVEKAELVAAFEAVETQRRRLEAVDARLLAHAEEASLASSCGHPAVAGVLAAALRLDGRAARRRLERAAQIGPRRSLGRGGGAGAAGAAAHGRRALGPPRSGRAGTG